MANRSSIPVVTYIARAAARGLADRESRSPGCNHSRQTKPILCVFGLRREFDVKNKANQTQFLQARSEVRRGSGPGLPSNVTFLRVAWSVILAGSLNPWRSMVRSTDD